MSYAMIATLTAFLGLIIADVVIYKLKGKNKTISAHFIRQAYKFPMIPFTTGIIVGFVCGHLFWRMNTLDIYECDSPYVQNIITTCGEGK